MDNQLLRQLYGKYYKEIYLYLFSLCRNREIAEDLVQETFLKALLSLSSEHTNMKAWLYMVARNLYFNYCNREKRKLPLEEEMIDSLPDEQIVGQLERLIINERAMLLYQALQQLDTQKREILTLQYFGELSQKDIARLLKISAENVRVQVHRAKRELKKYMEDNGYDIL